MPATILDGKATAAVLDVGVGRADVEFSGDGVLAAEQRSALSARP